MQLIALRTHWASLAPQLVVLQVSSQRLQREARLRRFVRLDSTGLPAACPHPSLSSAANQSTLKTCQEHFRVLHWIMHWGGAAWQQSVEEADTTRGATADEELFDTPWRLSSSAWHQWSREAGIPVVLLATPTAAERAAKQHSATSAPHWLKIVLSSATEHHWTTCVAGQQRQPGSKTRSRTEALTQWQTLVANSLEDSFRQQVAGPWNTQAETTRLANQSDGFATQHDHGFPPQLPTTVEDGPSAATALMVFPPPTGGRSNLSFSDTTSIEPTSYRESTNDRIAAPGAPRSLPTDDWATPPPVEEPQSHQPAQLSPPRQPAQQGSNRGRTLKPRAPASVEQSYRPPQ